MINPPCQCCSNLNSINDLSTPADSIHWMTRQSTFSADRELKWRWCWIWNVTWLSKLIGLLISGGNLIVEKPSWKQSKRIYNQRGPESRYPQIINIIMLNHLTPIDGLFSLRDLDTSRGSRSIHLHIIWSLQEEQGMNKLVSYLQILYFFDEPLRSK